MSDVIWEDTRNKPGKHELKRHHFESEGWRIARTKLYVGDYMLPGGLVSIDTKEDIYELASDLRQQHDRFRRECERADESGIKLVILVENEDGVADLYGLADWIEPPKHFSMRQKKSKGRVKKRLSGTQLYKACKTMEGKYGVRFEFCPPSEAGARVLEILGDDVHGRDDA